MDDIFKAKLSVQVDGESATIEVDGDRPSILHAWLTLTMQIEEQTGMNLTALAAAMLTKYKDYKKVTVDLGKISEAQNHLHGNK